MDRCRRGVTRRPSVPTTPGLPLLEITGLACVSTRGPTQEYEWGKRVGWRRRDVPSTRTSAMETLARRSQRRHLPSCTGSLSGRISKAIPLASREVISGNKGLAQRPPRLQSPVISPTRAALRQGGIRSKSRIGKEATASPAPPERVQLIAIPPLPPCTLPKSSGAARQPIAGRRRDSADGCLVRRGVLPHIMRPSASRAVEAGRDQR